MKRWLFLIALSTALIGTLIGCQSQIDEKVDQAQESGKAIKEGAGKLAQSAWISANEQANKLTENSKTEVLSRTKVQLVDLQTRLANTRLAGETDTLRLAYVEEQILRLDAAMDLKDIRAKLEAKSGQTQGQIRDLQAQLEEAKTNYQAAEETVQSLKQQLKDLGAIIPQ